MCGWQDMASITSPPLLSLILLYVISFAITLSVLSQSVSGLVPVSIHGIVSAKLRFFYK